MVPAIIEAEISDLDVPSPFDHSSPSPTPDAALASITGNGLPSTSALPVPALPIEPSEVMDRGDQMYTKAMREGLLPVSPTQADPLLHSFEDRLYMSFATNPQTHRQFLPKGQLNSLIRKQPVIQELKRKIPGIRRSSYYEGLAKTICDNKNPAEETSDPPGKSYQKVFAILVLINMVPAIKGFIDEGICDQDLPLVKAAENGGLFDLRVEARRKVRLDTFLSWTRVSIRNFEEYQWTILPPFFTKGQRKNVKHYVLEPHIVLPFTSTSNYDDIGATEMHGGGFSRVFKAEIHPDHHDFSNSALEPSMRPNTFAVKCLNSPSKELFQKEVQVLKKFSGDSHPHLISLLATYEQSGHFYLIFPWAEADLMKYWKELNPRPMLRPGTISWMAEQCQGISDGLVRLHQYDSDLQEKAAQSSSLLLTPLDALGRDHESSKRRYGRHGDIKPENMLWFRDTLQSIDQGILRLTDFGLAELHTRLSRSNQHGSQVANSPTYRPPECDLCRRIIRQSYDIWSLGCLFLEFITWSLGGRDLLLEFAQLRFSPDPWLSGIDSDTFFKINNSEAKDSSAASVKPAVVHFVDRLHSHPACSEYLHHFLNMIMYGMLVVESEDLKSGDRRMTCIEVRQKLSVWRDMCVASPRFCSEPAQRPLDDQSWNSCFNLHSTVRSSQVQDLAGHSSKIVRDKDVDFAVFSTAKQKRLEFWCGSGRLRVDHLISPPQVFLHSKGCRSRRQNQNETRGAVIARGHPPIGWTQPPADDCMPARVLQAAMHVLEARQYFPSKQQARNALVEESFVHVPLDHQLEQCFATSKFDERDPTFLPDGSIETLVTDRAISGELFDDEVPQTPEKAVIRFVQEKAKKVFAIAVGCGVGGDDLVTTIKFFRSIGFDDSHLPVAKPETPKQNSPTWAFPFPFDQLHGKRLLRIWKGTKVKTFYSQQWGFLAPVFSKTKFQHYLSPDCIFPFTWVNNIVKGGMFSRVYEVEIHPKHQENPELTVDGHLAHVAIKEILVNNDLRQEIEKNYEDERTALSEITDLRHPHIIQRIAAISRGEKRYFMFQWADGGNLREFWKEQNRPSLTPDLVGQTIAQLCGLADALHALHNYKGQGNYRHGDLKPENILRFRDKTCFGILKIADMGLAKHHNDATAVRKKPTSAKYGTVRYEPPEAVTNRLDKARSRLYDIWSMGCIMLECIIWLLYGYEALDSFDDSLSADGYDCSFFKVKEIDGARVAEVHPIVVRWMDSMAADHQCGRDSAIGDLLNLVRTRLLIVPLLMQAPTRNLYVPQTTFTENKSISVTSASQTTFEIGPYRADAKAMRSGLEDILQKADSDRNYLSKAQDRRHLNGPASTIPRSQSHDLLSPGMADKPRGNNLFPGTLQAQRLSDHWRFSRDNSFARRYIRKVHDKIPDDLSLPQVQNLCQRCEKLDILATGFYLFDTVSDLQERAGTCGFCMLLSKACQSFKKTGSLQLNREGSTLKMAGITDPVLSIVHDTDSTSSKYDSLGLQVGFPRLAPGGHQLHFEVLRQWLQSCDQGSEHRNCLQATEVNLPTRLLDVSNSQIRLWETNGACGQYLALSHPWGDPAKHRHFCTYTNNTEEHKRGIDFDDLPATFKDAITTTRELGFKHLWIDSICIVQGADGDFKEESKHMEDVFSFAYCVIAASRATGQEDGFLGPRPERDYVTFNLNNSGNYHVCQQIDDFERDVIEGKLNKRGWVLQERALAHRTIYFTERQTYWECGQGVRCETMTKLDNNVAAFLGDPRFPTIAMNSPRGAKIHLYQDLYKQYSRLQFSRNEDRPFGIAGLEKRLIQSFKTHGGYGVFDDGGGLLRRSLLWQRGSDSTLDRIIFPAERDLEVPTWSWMAYKGGIDYLEPPFDGVDWEKSEIQSPWANKSPDGVYHTSDKSLGISLSAVAREFSQLDTNHSASKLIFDNPAKSDGQLPNVRVIVVGRSRNKTQDSERKCFVLIVTPKAMKHAAGMMVYERTGVGYMSDSCISQNGTPVKIQ
ncbi:hypothetical protein BDP81DRAFT_350654 [Colletotrichum phormii]|uniref:Protein kinase domain-containing protein n=1 Tax=Colletotrichum phormii TaxID=359342 RepID=A0AAI9ZP12_9PEZI|nr:uncharacterized protein BDP81DRAFT_350654 [Colletotrichum phormii]KAK1635547.1 hypothetical protein BDP81DRAFT_350654 [Colletotrichum phormii]